MAYVVKDMFETGIAVVKEDDQGFVVCEVWPQDVNRDDYLDLPIMEDKEAVRLAHLFSAAPELLHACKAVSELLEPGLARGMLLAAISKAEGCTFATTH